MRHGIRCWVVWLAWAAGPLTTHCQEMVVHFDFSRTAGTRVPDQSGHQRHGHVVGAGLTPDRGRRVLRLDGVDDYVDVAGFAELGLNQLSVELWCKPARDRVPLISQPFSPTRSSLLLQLSGDPLRVYGQVLDPDGTREHYLETRRLDLAGRWTHAVLTCDGRWLRLFLNGRQETFSPIGQLPTNTGRQIPYADRRLQIGRSYYAPRWNYYAGDLGELRIYDRPLTAAQVSSHFRAAAPTWDNRWKVQNPAPESVTQPPPPAPKKPAPGDLLDLVRAGKPAATIVIPNRASYWTNTAAHWLQDYVEQTTGAQLRLVDDRSDVPGAVISVGHTRLAREAKIDLEDIRWDGARLVVRDNRLYLIGHNVKASFQNAESKIADGNCRAVVTFLEDHCGIRWFLPGPNGTVIPQQSELRVPRSLDKRFNPAFAFSSGRFPYGSQGHWKDNITPAAIANNYRSGIACTSGGHTYYAMVPAAQYFDQDPTMFALIDGRRQKEGNHLCTTHPEVRRLLIRGLRKQLDRGYDVVTLGQEDGYARCQCENCEALDRYRFRAAQMSWRDFQRTILRNTPCERLFLLHQSVIQEVQRSHPQATVLLFAYAPTAWPSHKIERWGDRVWVELTQQDDEIIGAWKGKAGGLTGYVYWFDIQLPAGMDVHATPDEVAQRIRYLHKNGFLGLYHFPETNFGFQGPVIYTLGKLMGDPALDPDQLVDEFCHGIYGSAAVPMKQFFDLLYSVHQERFPFHLRQGDLWPAWLSTTDLYLMLYTPPVLARLESLLQTAQAAAETERSRGWVKQTREFLDFTTLLTTAVTAYRRYQRQPTEPHRLEVQQRVEQFDTFRMKILRYEQSYTDRWFPGHDHFCNWLTAGARHESQVYYTPWSQRKADVLARGVRGLAIGYGGGPGYSYVKEPFTLDSKKPSR